MNEPDYRYRCEILRVVDGDTLDVRIDLGFSTSVDQRVRLHGLDAPERFTADGKRVMQILRDLVASLGGDGWLIQTHQDRREKYGRYLGELFFPESRASLNAWLLERGLAQVRQPN